MCKLLKLSRSYYYKLNKLRLAVEDLTTTDEQQYIDMRIEAIYTSNKNYGSRKISAILKKESINYSPYKVLKRMKQLALSSLYNIRKRFKPYGNNNSNRNTKIENVLLQQFTKKEQRNTLTSDLTYVKHKTGFYYICFIIDLYNREIVAHGVSNKHDSELVCNTLNQINLERTKIFHSDRGKEFVNINVSNLLKENNVVQSLSKAGCPYDNAVSENLFGIFKREWMKHKYETLRELEIDVNDFVLNYNNFRVHSKLQYMSPIEYRLNAT